VSLDRETGRDRYFEERGRGLEALRGRAVSLREVDCPLCGSAARARLFEKHGFTFVRCRDCGLVFVNPQLEEAVVLEEYRTAATNDLWFDVLSSARQQELDRRKFAEVLDALEPYRGRILDVGCSLGLFLALARERGWDGIGLELAPRALAHAREVHGLEVLDVSLEEARFEDGSFDSVALLSTLEHVVEPLALLRESARVLRPGGALYVIVPNVDSLACRALGAQARTFDGRNHLVYFSAATLTDALGRSGFDVVRTTTRIGSLGPVLASAAGREPYADDDHPLSAWLAERGDDLERDVEQLGLGYKLHGIAVKPS